MLGTRPEKGRAMENKQTRRSKAWLKAAVVCLVLLIAAVGAFLAWVQASRGPKGEGVWEVVERMLEDGWHERLRDLGVDGVAEAVKYAEVKALASEAAGLVESVYTEAAGFTGPSRLDLARPMWGDGRALAPLPEFYPSDEALRSGSDRSLELAQEREMLERVRAVEVFEGGLLDPRSRTNPGLVHPSEARAVSILLSLAYVEAIEGGDEAGAIEAFGAMQGWALLLLEASDWHEQAAAVFMADSSRLVFDTIELGLMTESLVAGLLSALAPIDAAEYRVRILQNAPVGELISLAGSSGWGRYGPSVYGDDGRVKFAVAAKCRFRPVETMPYSPVEIESPGFGGRHATMAEIAEYFRARADESEDVFRSSRRERGENADNTWTPMQLEGVVFPSGLNGMWHTPLLARRGLDELELMRGALELVLAIEVYRSREGGPPDSLGDLTPRVLASAPVNPWNSAGAFGYRADADSRYGYRLWIPAEYDPNFGNRRPIGPAHLEYAGGEYAIVPRATR